MTSIKSMTGYACVHSHNEASGDYIEVSLKSVNGRYLELINSNNYELGTIEQELNKQCKAVILRGKVNININYHSAKHQLLELNEDMLSNVLEHLATIKQRAADHNIDPLELLKFPGVVTNLSASSTERNVTLTKAQGQELLALFAKALVCFDEQRQKEGTQLELILKDKISKIKTLLGLIDNKQATIVERERERLNQKLKNLKVDIDPSRLEGEVALLAQKCDITEEFDRLKCHIKAVEELISPNDKPYTAVGKKLDFLMQELMRETNTMASKANSLDLLDIAVDLKVLIDQMREQIQNIE